MATVGQLEDEIRQLREQFEEFASKFADNSDTNKQVVAALAEHNTVTARISSLESRVHELDGKVAD